MSGASLGWSPLLVSLGGLGLTVLGSFAGSMWPASIPTILFGIFVCGLVCGLVLAAFRQEAVMLDKATLLFVADNMMARANAERIMRDNARREGKQDIATMHGDRAQAFTEAAAAIPALAAVL